MTAPDIVVVGAASRDLRPSDPRGWRLGGGVTYSARLLGQLGLSVGALIGVDSEASEAHELDELRDLGVVTEMVPLEQGPVFDNRQTHAGRVQIAYGVSDELPPQALPVAWQTACAYLLNPVAGEIGQVWAKALPSDALVGLGYQGLLRTLRPGAPIQARPLVPGPLSQRADLAALSSEDVRAGAPPLRRLLARDEQRLVVTEGSLGALHVRRSSGRFLLRFVPAVPAESGTDATGAGDTFLAAWLAATFTLRERDMDDARCLALAALCASLLVEGNGISRSAIRDRSARLRLRDAGRG
ncbi:MAG: PfkB family carbohydrate kinase [Chloroflexota bacterium]|nr:PfkB family carbohydrate kinase [Chloroflexota bacterium]